MKKLLAFVLACVMIIPCVSAMAERVYVEGVYENDTLTVTYNEAEGDIATIALYDEGRLCGIKTAKVNDGKYTFNVSEDDKDKEMRIFYYGEKSYPVEIATPAPVETPAPKPTRTPYPEAYEKSVDALNAPAIVDGVAQVFVDGDICYELTLWYQGRKVVTNVREKVVVESAPANMSSLIGQNVSCLEAGDIIHITCNMQGQIRSVEFIMRPDFADYFEDGISTTGMVGDDGQSQYVFGAAVGVYESAIEMADENGDIVALDVNPKAFVYNISSAPKRAYVTLNGTGALLVPQAYIPDENISGATVSWNGVTEIPYVLARISRDTVTDIIVFE